jgi:iron complex transport system ATP-binding protein
VSDILDIQKLTCAFGKQNVFQDISLSAAAGEIVCLMGPNGSGKTTLIDTVMAVNRQKSGTVTLMGKPVQDYKRHEIARITAYVPQIHDITFPYTVREIILMGRTAYTNAFGHPSKEDEQICMEAARRVGIDALADKPYSRLSGGEVKLVLLARPWGRRRR